MARNYSENLREEVKKGMREKASQGVYPGHAPFGYRNNKAERTIETDPIDSPIVNRLFELYATGAHSLATLQRQYAGKLVKRSVAPTSITSSKTSFYTGSFEWSGQTYLGTHTVF